jgi:hypothetical protein
VLSSFFEIENAQNALELACFANFENCFLNSNQLINALAIAIEFPAKSKIFYNKTFENVKFNRSSFSHITFKNCTFRDCLFVGCKFSDVEFHDTHFYDCNFYKAKFSRVYIDVRLVNFDRSYRRSHSNIMLGFYQEIFDNYADAHQWKFALFADIRRRQWDRYQILYNIRGWKKEQNRLSIDSLWVLLKRGGSYLGNFLSEYGMCFGYGPVRFLTWTGILLCGISAVVLANWASFGFAEMPHSPRFADALFYVVTIWSTLGYSSLVPSSETGKYISSFFGMLGLAWTGLFTAILIRRFVR